MIGGIGLLDGERISMIRSAVLIQYTHVTDGRTELAWHIRAIAYMLSRVKIKMFELTRERGLLYVIYSERCDTI